jgi:hypothetical protein
LPPRAQLPTCFHALARARPTSLPAIRCGMQATCCLSASAIGTSTNTPPHVPNSDPLGDKHHSRPDDDASCETPPAKLSQARGQTEKLRTSPHSSSRLPEWIYPNLFDSDAPCHQLAPRVGWRPTRSGRAAIRPSQRDTS